MPCPVVLDANVLTLTIIQECAFPIIPAMPLTWQWMNWDGNCTTDLLWTRLVSNCFVLWDLVSEFSIVLDKFWKCLWYMYMFYNLPHSYFVIFSIIIMPISIRFNKKKNEERAKQGALIMCKKGGIKRKKSLDFFMLRIYTCI